MIAASSQPAVARFPASACASIRVQGSGFRRHVRTVLGLALLLLPQLTFGTQSTQLAAKSESAKAAMTAGKYDVAAQLYHELVRALPGNPGLRMNLGLALHSAGKYRAALEQFRLVVTQQPKNSSGWLLIGLAHLKLGEPGLAVRPLRRVLTLDPKNNKARLELADAYLSSGRPEHAATQFRRLTELDSSDPKAWQGLGLSYVALSRQAFEAIEKSAPDSAYSHILAARSFATRLQYHAAFSHYRQALDRNPLMRDIHAGLAEVYRNTGHPEWASIEEGRESDLGAPDCTREKMACEFAARHYAKVVEATHSLVAPASYYWRARAASELSFQAFDRLGHLQPSAAVHELMAEAHLIQGRPELAVHEWNEALQFAPADRRLKKALGHALRLNKEYGQARALFEGLLRSEPDSIDLHYELGEILLRTEQAETAIPHLKQVVKSSPNHMAAHAALGLAYMRVGRPEEAIPHLKPARQVEEDGSLYYQLAQAYQRAGQQALARETMQQFEEISKTARARRQKLPEEFKILPP